MNNVTYAGRSHWREVQIGPLLQLDEDDERFATVLRWDADTPTLEVDDDVAEALPLRTSKREWVIEGVDAPTTDAAAIADQRVSRAEKKAAREAQLAADQVRADEGEEAVEQQDDSEKAEN